MRLSEQRGRWLSLLALGLACALFTAQFLSQRSLWWDEVLLAFNLRERNLLELTQALDYDQAAPIGFLWLSKLIAAPFGYTDAALRLISLGAGYALLSLSAVLVWRIQASMTPLLVLMLGTNNHLIYYANEFKQYMLDAALAMALLSLTLVALQAPNRRTFLWLTSLGALAVWFSHPQLFVLAGCGLVLLWQARQQARPMMPILASGALWLLSFGIAYGLFYRTTSANPNLQNYWQNAFIEPSASAILRAFLELMSYISVFNLPFFMLCIFGLILGIYRLPRYVSLLLLAPVLLAAVASALRQYPFEGRLITFSLAPLCIVVVAGWWQVLQALAHPQRRLASLLGLGLALLLLMRVQLPQTKTEVRPLLEAIRAQDANATLYTDAYASAIADYYGYASLPQSAWTEQASGWWLSTGTPNDAPALLQASAQRIVLDGAYAIAFSATSKSP